MNVGAACARIPLFFKRGSREIKCRGCKPHPLSSPKIPLFHHSIVPIGVSGTLDPSSVKSKTTPLDSDSLLMERAKRYHKSAIRN